MGREGMQVVCCGGDRFVWWCREASSDSVRKIGKLRGARDDDAKFERCVAPVMDVRTEAVWKVEARLLDDRLNGTTNLLPTWPEDEEPKPGIKPAAVTTSPSGVRRIAAPRCTPLDLLRLQAITNDSPPRGLLLVVGCVGVLLNLTDTLPSGPTVTSCRCAIVNDDSPVCCSIESPSMSSVWLTIS